MVDVSGPVVSAGYLSRVSLRAPGDCKDASLLHLASRLVRLFPELDIQDVGFHMLYPALGLSVSWLKE